MSDDDDTLTSGEDDRTVVVQREQADHTVVVDRTVVIGRGRRSPAPDAPLPAVTEPPVRPWAGRPSVAGAGAGAVADYPARALPPLPAPVAPVPRGEDARGRASAALPSVRRRSRRAAIVTLLAFVAACAVSVAGLVAVIVWFVRA